MSLLAIAESTWGDLVDLYAVGAFFAAAIILPAMGYFFMVADYRTYLRSLRRALVKVVSYFPDIPDWARQESPRCITALGLRLPCTEEDVKKAYLKQVKRLHPDRGGDRRRFEQLQMHFEEATKLVEQRRTVFHATSNASGA